MCEECVVQKVRGWHVMVEWKMRGVGRVRGGVQYRNMAFEVVIRWKSVNQF